MCYYKKKNRLPQKKHLTYSDEPINRTNLTPVGVSLSRVWRCTEWMCWQDEDLVLRVSGQVL